MKIDPETGNPTFENIGDLLDTTSKAIHRTNAGIERAISDGNRRDLIDALTAKSLYMSHQIPQYVDSMEAAGQNVQIEVKTFIKRLSAAALDAYAVNNWHAIETLPGTKSQTSVDNPFDKLAKKY